MYKPNPNVPSLNPNHRTIGLSKSSGHPEISYQLRTPVHFDNWVRTYSAFIDNCKSTMVDTLHLQVYQL